MMMSEVSPAEQKATSSLGHMLASTLNVLWKFVLIASFVLLGLFVGGFLKFSSVIADYQTPQDIKKADAIVVLTGGSSRIARALDLIENEKGARLLISGVNKSTKAVDIRKVNHARQTLFDCCVDVERKALNTIGNAVESRKWANAHGFKSLIVVTSSYHMPRTILEFRRAMPEQILRFYPVPLHELKREGWWKNVETLRFVLSEYIKYVGAGLRDYVRPELFSALHPTTRKV